MPTPRPNAVQGRSPAAKGVHREWFMPTSYGLCDCGSTKRTRTAAGKDTTTYVWGEYVVGRWRTVQRVCECCFQSVAIPRLRAHATPCGCSFQLVPRHGHSLPPWITLEGSGIRCAA